MRWEKEGAGGGAEAGFLVRDTVTGVAGQLTQVAGRRLVATTLGVVYEGDGGAARLAVGGVVHVDLAPEPPLDVGHGRRRRAVGGIVPATVRAARINQHLRLLPLWHHIH